MPCFNSCSGGAATMSMSGRSGWCAGRRRGAVMSDNQPAGFRDDRPDPPDNPFDVFKVPPVPKVHLRLRQVGWFDGTLLWTDIWGSAREMCEPVYVLDGDQ
jgi:hypothetical protein